MASKKRLSPSGFPLLVACAGSYLAQQGYPDESSEAAEEGTRAHAHAALLLRSKYEGGTGYNTDTEMDAHIQLYVDHVVSIVGDGKPHIEEKMDIKSLHPNAKGTPDAWFYDEVRNELHVWDFKYGFGPVEVKENWQLMGYAAGIIEVIDGPAVDIKDPDFNDRADRYCNKKIYLHIIQPRARHKDGAIRTWEILGWDFEIFKVRLEAGIYKAHQPDAPFTAGEHCRYCKARLNCAEFKKTSKILSHIPESTELTPGLIGAELTELNRAAKIIDYRITTLVNEAEKILKSGGFVAGYKLKPSFSRDKWDCEDEDLDDLFEGYERYLLPMLTPAQAKKAGVKTEGYTKREFLGDRVVSDKDVIEIDWDGAKC